MKLRLISPFRDASRSGSVSTNRATAEGLPLRFAGQRIEEFMAGITVFEPGEVSLVSRSS